MQNYEQYFAGDDDAREYQIKIVFFTLLIYAGLAAYVSGWLDAPWMVVLVSIATTRWMIAIHELFHLRKPESLNFFIRLQPLPFTPFSLGYREFQAIHIGHHKHPATEHDPDGFHILGGPLRALFGAITLNEQATLRHVLKQGLSGELLLMMSIRAGIFFALLAAFPEAFLIWWLAMRVSFIVNDFVFFHLVHYRGGRAGTFSLPLPKALARVAAILYGSDVVHATMHHDVHHQYNMIAPKHLPLVAARLADGAP